MIHKIQEIAYKHVQGFGNFLFKFSPRKLIYITILFIPCRLVYFQHKTRYCCYHIENHFFYAGLSGMIWRRWQVNSMKLQTRQHLPSLLIQNIKIKFILIATRYIFYLKNNVLLSSGILNEINFLLLFFKGKLIMVNKLLMT